MTSYSNPPPATRTAKTLTNYGITVTTAVGSPPVSENCLGFGGSNYFTMDNVNASWAATSRNATDGGLNGKVWPQLDGQFTYEFSFYYQGGSFPGQLGLFEMGSSAPAIGCTPSFAFFADSGSSYYFQTSYSFAANTWYTMAYTRYFVGSQGYLGCWINGVYQNNYTDNKNWQDGSTAPFWGGGFGSTYLTGQMQEIRISNIARYTAGSNYTVPSITYSNDANTILLVNGPAGVVDNNT
jgi:hypothetical protein